MFQGIETVSKVSSDLSGLVVGGIGIWTVISKHNYVSLMTTSTYPTLAYALIVAGALAVVGSWLGCGGVTSENRCVLLIIKLRFLVIEARTSVDHSLCNNTYVFVVMLVFVLEAGVGALARLYEEQVGPELKMNLNRTFLENYAVRRRETSAIDQMQIEFKCCGALRFEDWVVSEWHKDENVLKNGSLVPDSCCKTPTLLCGRRDHPSNIHYTVSIDFQPANIFANIIVTLLDLKRRKIGMTMVFSRIETSNRTVNSALTKLALS
ncbi:Tetraspanin-11 [Apis cerana cerana]|uniref:Tetraspanin-11 n=1 Tax=Apis cerana cerana TaxID=94128 RepID=A0A2A3ESZ9_APICC|nr:Tetraspanin-11 [Apis cerana cerana]